MTKREHGNPDPAFSPQASLAERWAWCRQLRVLALLAVLFTLVNGCSDPPATTSAGVSKALASQRAERVSNLRYQLLFEIPAARAEPITARIGIHFSLSDASTPLALDFSGDAELIQSVTSNGRDTRYVVSNEHILMPPSALVPGVNHIDIKFIAGSSSLNRNPEYLHTLFVPDRARSAFPLFDQPDLKAVYDLTLLIPVDWVAIANAPPLAITTSGNQRTYRFASTQLISSYLFSFVAGRFESITRKIGGRSMTLLHRETDQAKLSRNIDTIFMQHAAAVDWLENYTGIEYPFQKLDFALIPAFPYGGMEHPGAIQYRAESLLLEQSPSQRQLLDRANLIAHESAHMWFGNLVTMRWFDDVWTKEVFANFMAAKLVNPAFPDINHDLNFMLRHLPAAYAVDRSNGANPIRQQLANLNEAGQLYGAIIYHKAPVMMRQLELLLGADIFKQGMQQYLRHFSFGNASWPELISILDPLTDTDLAAWSKTWVDSPGRPEFAINQSRTTLSQRDPDGLDRIWPQYFSLGATQQGLTQSLPLNSLQAQTPLPPIAQSVDSRLIFNSDGYGYGLFPANIANLALWTNLSALSRGAMLINLYESVLNQSAPVAEKYFQQLLGLLDIESNPILLDQILSQIYTIHQRLFSALQRERHQHNLEGVLWQRLSTEEQPATVRTLFEAWSALASSAPHRERLYRIWSGALAMPALQLSENDDIRLAEILAIRLPAKADTIIAQQLLNIENPDSRRRLKFIAPALSSSAIARDRFFESLALAQNRTTESWVLDALEYLHHPSRTVESEKYLARSLELLTEIQVTGDIFFPTGWLQRSLQNHHSAAAVATIRDFLVSRPDYNPQLRMKILQAADIPLRARAMAEAQSLMPSASVNGASQ